MQKNAVPFRLIVHVGAGKTGTSSIQSFLSTNESLLKRKGIYILGESLNKVPSKKYSWQKKGEVEQLLPNNINDRTLKAKEIFNVLEESIPILRQQGIHTAIWSHEAFLKRGHLFLDAFKKLTENNVTIEIIAYIRRHDAWAKSAYIQWGIKHKTYIGPLQNFNEWISHGERFNFGRALQKWDTNFVKLIVRNFDSTEDVVKDFVETLSLKIKVDNNINIRKNTSPSKTALSLWALYNAQKQEKSQEIELAPFLRQANILYDEPNIVHLNQLLPTSEDLQKIIDICREDRSLINTILAKQGQPLLETSTLTVKPIEVSNEQLFAAMLSMIMTLKERLDKLETKAINNKQA